MKQNTYDLRLPPTLHQRLPPPKFCHCLDIVRKAICQARQTQRPEQQAEWERDPSFNTRGLAL